ncbi:hypothetical protein BsWGS_19234 [Bradybaena similaris]
MRGIPGVIRGICPNPECKMRLFFPAHEASVECTGCGQRHTQSGLDSLGPTEWYELEFERLLYELQKESQRTTKLIQEAKVNGLSNYLCTILSPLLTIYGMDRTTGKAKLLTEMGKPPIFDCAQLGDRAFLIDPQHLSIPGYGRDRSGSHSYLQDTLHQIKAINENEERLVPIHADGDGHCLVHAVSRALVGWELFWHPLRVNLKKHFIENIHKYKVQFQDFIDAIEWDLIIEECDPDFVPKGAEPTGLRNIHIFGLANVLKRPIVLLDSLEGIQSPGDYSAIFLPCFSPPSECMNKEGVLNKPICIAWSSLARNHFIPLVGVRGRKCPVLSRHMIYRAWGIADSEIEKYVSFDSQGNCQIAGEKVLQITYVQRLVAAMSDVFFQQHEISPSLFADVYQQIFKANGLMFGMNVKFLLEKTRICIVDKLLHLCLSCWSLSLVEGVKESSLLPGGEFYDLAVACHGNLKDGQKYSFPIHDEFSYPLCGIVSLSDLETLISHLGFELWHHADVIAEYSASQNKLIVIKSPTTCDHCGNKQLRLVRADYTIEYKNGDRTSTRSSKSPTGFKHFWNGREYDTIPKQIPVVMEWRDRRLETKVLWFQDEDDPSLNSNVYSLAMNLVQDNFPGEFGSERLVQKVVDQILRQTNQPESEKPPVEASGFKASSASNSLDAEDDPATWSPHRASKAILLGLQRQSVHKEELNKSATERQIKQRIETNASKQQRKLSDQAERKHSSPSPEGSSRRTPERRLSSPSSLSSSKVPSSSTTAQSATAVSSVASDAVNTREVADTSKRIRLSISDGRNVTLNLPFECTFLELQILIYEATEVLPTQQCIRHGFPPRELKPPASTDEDYKVPVQPGDKIMLDILGSKQESSSSSSQPATHSQSTDKSKIHGLPARKEESSWNTFAEGGVDEASDRVLQGLMDPLWPSGGDNLDHSLSALVLTAALDNKDIWSYVQLRPHLFSVNGLFYKQVERDVGLKHGKHCHLPMLPHKVFVYNQHDDRLELCLEPYGHFPIENNVEKHAGCMLPVSKCSSKSQQQPFSGQGHSLKSGTSQEERMPTDIPMSPKRHEVRRLNTMCDPTKHQESIEEEDEEAEEVTMEETQEDHHNTPKLLYHRLNPSQVARNLPLTWSTPATLNLLTTPESRLVRKGPGYSELSPIPENANNERNEMLHQLVSRIEQACETMEQEAQAISEAKQLTPAQVLSPLSPTAAAVSAADVPASGHLVCTSSSLPYHSQHHVLSKSSTCDISSFTKESSSSSLPPCVLHTESQSATCVSDSSSCLQFRTDRHGLGALSDSNTGLVTTLLSPDPAECAQPVPDGAECHGQDPSQTVNDEVVLADTDPARSVSVGHVEEADVAPRSRLEGSGDGDKRLELTVQENMETEVQRRETEYQGEGCILMDTECVKDDHHSVTPMEDEEGCRPEEETTKEEFPVDMSETAPIPDI